MTDWTLYLVTDPDLAGGPDNVPHIVSQAISGGVSVVQYATNAPHEERYTSLLRISNHGDELLMRFNT